MMIVDDERWEDGMQAIKLQGLNDWVNKLLNLGKDALCSGNIPFSVPWYYSMAVDIAKGILC